MSEPANHTYLLRVWGEAEHGQSRAFRAALTDVATRETRYFTDVKALARHLRSLQGVPPDPAP
ncbi:MAG: hypothetical protein P8Y05_07800 [Deinococcales bacterium]